MSKVITLDQCIDLIQDGASTVWTTAGLAGFPEYIADGIENRFLETGKPQNLTAIHSCGCGDGKTRGMNHLGHEGLIGKIIAGHIGEAPKIGELVRADKIEAHLLPQGVMSHLWRHIAGKKMGVITKVGLGTFVDPRQTGGKVSPCTKDELVKVIELEGEEWLLYKTFPIDIAFIRGTTADEKGNLTMDKEPLFLEAISMAQAVKNGGGIVIAQVEYVSKPYQLHPQSVKVPGNYIDYIVVAPPEQHMQTKGTVFNPALNGDVKVPLNAIPKLPLIDRKIIARRAAMELMPNTVVNLGIGMPEGIASVAAEEGVSDYITMTTELGTYGGIPASGVDFATAYNAEAIIDHQYQFDFYDGGGLAGAFLGLAETDQFGNLNVSKFGEKVVGPGGFINISQNSKKVVFCGTFTAGGLKTEVKDGKLVILNEGAKQKFVEQVDHITFSGQYASQVGQPVLYVTERAVFKLEAGGLTLIEVAPGIDVERDILSQMAFKPRISEDLKQMPAEIFETNWGGLQNVMKL
ncbi:MAG: propionate CoA-transferase [Clostridiales bacterium]|jgi:propionate CoA-transferase|nr:propionate CoA-transferase [Clostridiales bacterium]